MAIFNNNQFLSVSCFINDANTLICSALLLKFEEDILDVVEQWESIELSELPKKHPVILNICGKGIICKQSTDKSAIQLKQLFPGLKITDFSVQYFNNISNNWVAIARYSLISSVLNELNKHKLYVFSVSISELSVIELNNILPQKLNGVYTVNNKSCTFINGVLTQFQADNEHTNEQQHIQIEELNHEQIVNFANAVTYLQNQQSPIQLSILDNNKEEWKYKNYTKFITWLFPLIIVSIGIICYLLTLSYKQEANQLQSVFLSNKSLIQQLNKQKQNIEQYKLVEENSVIAGMSKSSYYIDRIMKSIPNQIYLSELIYHPAIKSKKNEYAFTKQQIALKGTCPNNQLIIQWISELENIDFIKSVEGPKLSSTKSIENSFFEISINYRHE